MKKSNNRGGQTSRSSGGKPGRRNEGTAKGARGDRTAKGVRGEKPNGLARSADASGVVHRPVQKGPPQKGRMNPAFAISGKERLSLGIHSVREALKVRPGAIKRLGLRDDFMRAPQLKELADLAEASKIEIKSLTAIELDAIGSGHHGAAAVLTETPVFNLKDVKDLDPCVIVACDGLEDPANLGAILRSAWLLGAKGVLLPQDRSVSLTTAAAKVASGGAEHVPVEVCSNLPRELEILREAGFWVFGLAEKGTKLPWEFKLPSKIVWVIGSESSGLRVTVERACDELVKLPQVPGGSSFNAAVSASMALYESARQHGLPES